MTKKDFIALCNTKRKENTNSWVFINESVDNRNVQYKAFKTWIQILKIDGIDCSDSYPDRKVSEFINHLTNNL